LSLIKTIGFRAVALALGGVIAFGVAEVGLRVFLPQRTGPLQFTGDPRFGPVPVPSLRGQATLPGVWKYTFAHDSMGLRRTGLVERDGTKTKVLVLGDSFTYGLGVSDEQTFAAVLEQGLSRAGLSVDVINAGSPAQGTDYALRFVELVGHSFQPKLTVLCFFSNDFRDNRTSRIYSVNDNDTLSLRPTAAARSKMAESRRSTASWILTWSHVANLRRMMDAARRTRRIPPGEDPDYVNDVNRRTTRIYLHHFVKKVTETGSDLVVFYIPRGGEIKRYRETGTVSTDEATLGALLATVGHAPISLTPVIAGANLPLLALYYDEERRGIPNGHWTPAAHSLAASFMVTALRARLNGH